MRRPRHIFDLADLLDLAERAGVDLELMRPDDCLETLVELLIDSVCDAIKADIRQGRFAIRFPNGEIA